MSPKGMIRIRMDRMVYPPWQQWNCRCLKIDLQVLIDGFYPVVGSSVLPYRVAVVVVVVVALVVNVVDAAAVDTAVAVHIDIDIVAVAVGDTNVVLDTNYDCTYPDPKTTSHEYPPDHHPHHYYNYHHYHHHHQ